jgi:membrane protein
MVSLYVANIVFKHFYNVSFYNAIYGTLSSIVITLAYVYIFFLIFIFWAQFGFVDTNFKLVIIKVFFEGAFKNPHSFLVRYLTRLLNKNVVYLNKGERLKLDEFIGLIVIVMDGSLELTSENGLPVYIDRFSFFNVTDISENVQITASEESLLLIITKEQKEFLMVDSPVASAIFLSNEKILMM